MASRKGRSSAAESPVGNHRQDPERQQLGHARRRLVGALIMVLTALVILPLLLDSEPQALPDNIPIVIPSPDTSLSIGAPLAVAPMPSLESPQQGVSQPNAPAASGLISVPNGSVATVTPSTVVPSDDAPAIVPPVTPPTEPRGAATTSAAPVAPAPTPNSAPTDDGARALALLEGRGAGSTAAAATAPAAVAASPADGGRFLVQVGAFSTSSAADSMRERLAALGMTASIERVQTSAGERFRVRTGPFASRDAAEQVRERLRTAGLDSALISQ